MTELRKVNTEEVLQAVMEYIEDNLLPDDAQLTTGELCDKHQFTTSVSEVVYAAVDQGEQDTLLIIRSIIEGML